MSSPTAAADGHLAPGHFDVDPVIPGADPRLYNEDLAPVPKNKRTWTGYSIFAMW